MINNNIAFTAKPKPTAFDKELKTWKKDLTGTQPPASASIKDRGEHHGVNKAVVVGGTLVAATAIAMLVPQSRQFIMETALPKVQGFLGTAGTHISETFTHLKDGISKFFGKKPSFPPIQMQATLEQAKPVAGLLTAAKETAGTVINAAA